MSENESTISDLPDSAPRPERIGPYRIREVLGEGGMGTVYLAEQTEPVRRRVALKLIKLGMDTREVIARFESERQALALMNHPHVAAVYDAGATEQGRPYFAMEYVPGEPITEYCDKHHLSLPERLDLFMQVCHAIQHAHQKGIIHRDIKPSNVLVTYQDGKPVPKVIDFGVAKAINQRLTEKTVFTEQGQLIGTPAYMSPEQAEMTTLDVDTRTDVYSLGVLLYELLTGMLPFDPKSLRGAGFEAIQRIIREVEPSKPSTKLSTLLDEPPASAGADIRPGSGADHRGAARAEARGSLHDIARNRRADPRTLTRLIRGDLDWVTMKALEKDRTRRYATASDFAADILRHLRHEPVVAGPPSQAYRVRKFVRRNRGGVIAASVVLVVLLAGITGTTWGLLAAVDAREQAQQRADELETVTEFQASMLSEMNAEEMGRALFADLRDQVRESLEAKDISPVDVDSVLVDFDQTLRHANATDAALRLIDEQLLSRAVETIDKDFADQPLVRAALQHTVAMTYWAIGLYEPAIPLEDAALQARREELGDGHWDTLTSINSLGFLLRAMGKLTDAEPYCREALEGRRRVLGIDHPDTLESTSNMGVLLESMGKRAEAEPYFREALEARRRVLGDDDPDTLISINNMGTLLISMGKLPEAEPYFREALERRRRVLGDDHQSTLISISNMGYLLIATGKVPEAEPYYREALEAKRRVLGDDHPSTLTSINSMGSLLQSMGKLAQAEPYYREALEGRRRVQGDDHPRTLTSINNLGLLLKSMGKLAEAESYYREALTGRRRVLGNDRSDTLQSINNMGALLKSMGKLSEAEPYFRESLESHRRMLGDDHPNTLISINNMGSLLKSMGKLPEAEPYLREALEGCRRVLGDDHPTTLNSIHNVGTLLQAMDRLAEAEPYAHEALAGRRRVLGDDHPQTLTSINFMGLLLESMGKVAEAEPYFREALEGRRGVLGDDHQDTLSSMNNIGDLLRAMGKIEEAEALLVKTVDRARRSLPEGHWLTGVFLTSHGKCLAELKRYADAETALLEGHEILEASLGSEHKRAIKVIHSLADLYDAWHAAEPEQGYDAKGAEWRTKVNTMAPATQPK